MKRFGTMNLFVVSVLLYPKLFKFSKFYYSTDRCIVLSCAFDIYCRLQIFSY